MRGAIGDNMITASQIRSVWTAPRTETYGSIQDRLGLTGLELFCAQWLCRGMGDRGAAGFVNELTSRFSKGKDVLDFTRRRYPRRVRGDKN